MPFQFEQLEISGVVLVAPKVSTDERGFFMETYKRSEFTAAGIPGGFVQENHSGSARNILRGLHFQRPPREQAKLVRVVTGEIFDVAVDLRKDSSTFGKWVGVKLSAENGHMLYIPPWCAHGFAVVSQQADVIYKVTEEYSPECEGGILWSDPKLRIKWPVSEPVLSGRDRQWPPYEQAVEWFAGHSRP